ncbi:MAG: MopE-related protein [Myxococcota bacterium]
MTLLLLAACRYGGPGNADTSRPFEGEAPGEPDAPTTALCPAGRDADGDGYFSVATGGSDCNDLDAATHPGREDLLHDGRDPDCDGVDGPPAACVPGPETCDGADEDCDGLVDDPFALVLGEATVALVADGRVVTGDPSADVVTVYSAGGDALARLSGPDTFGQQLAAGRDLTGDGVGDLVVAAPYAYAVYVYAGPVTDGAQPAWTYTGGAYPGRPGEQLALLPDVTGDGLAELLVSNYRHMLLFSGVADGEPDAAWEISTGGGAWQVGTLPDVDGDALPEVVFGLSTYDSGKGMLVRWDSGDLVANPTYVVGADGQGLGGELAVVGDRLYTVDAGVLAEVSPELTRTSLGIEATAAFDAGDLDGDGVSDLVVADTRGLFALGIGRVPGDLTPQDRRDLGPAGDLDGDGIPDVAALLDGAVVVVDGTRFGDACDGDGDGVTVGDCDDGDPTAHPGAREVPDDADSDCDGQIDAPAEVALGWSPRWATGLGDADGDGSAEWAALASDGVAHLLDGEGELSERGTVTGGLAWATGLAGVGDTDGNGFVELLWRGEDVTALAPLGEGGDVFARAATTFGDGTVWRRGVSVGHAGDVDGDGLADVRMVVTADGDAAAVAIWTDPPGGHVLADDADTLLVAPSGWSAMTVASAPPGEPGDVDGDGRDDLLVGHGGAYGGNGRAMLLLDRPAGTHDLDAVAILSLWGEPGEALGGVLALGGDLDGDALADALVAGQGGARLLTGGPCPLPIRVAPGLTATSAAFVDLDGDGRAALFLADDAVFAVDAAGDVARWRDDPATLLFPLGDTDASRGGDLLYVTTADAVRTGGVAP